MELELLSICDAATQNFGKLNMLGVFDRINSKTVPFIHPACAIAIRLRFSKSERTLHKLHIDVMDADGNAIVPSLNGEMNIDFSDDELSMAANLIINIAGLRFENFGDYSINLTVDNTAMSSVPLFVRQAKIG